MNRETEQNAQDKPVEARECERAFTNGNENGKRKTNRKTNRNTNRNTNTNTKSAEATRLRSSSFFLSLSLSLASICLPSIYTRNLIAAQASTSSSSSNLSPNPLCKCIFVYVCMCVSSLEPRASIRTERRIRATISSDKPQVSLNKLPLL